jgi:NAD(P)-dependent dehydrogenase (short-subunit alcohol dehydrogenase family)
VGFRVAIKDEVLRSFSGKNVLVTGGTGLIGRQVVDLMVGAGAKVRIISLDKIKVNEKAEHVIGDLTNFELCKEVTAGMDCIWPASRAQPGFHKRTLPVILCLR